MNRNAHWGAIRVSVLAGVALAFSVSTLAGCSVPVFRYALERWPPAPYEIVVFHRGPLSAQDQDLLARLASNRPPVNLVVKVLDVAETSRPSAGESWRPPAGLALPAWSLFYPVSNATQRQATSGTFDEEAMSGLLDSPLRRRIAQRLLKGDSAVWVLLESGHTAPDEAAFDLLESRLEHLQKTLRLPKLASEDLANNVISVAESELKVAFSCERLSRSDPKERALVRMLLGSEADLAEEEAPMAFPIFGRGRLLYALVGRGINHETIDEACRLLVGPCSCVVKEENPGTDLLIAANWDSQFPARSTLPDQAIPLAGLTAFAAKTNQLPALGPPTASSKTPPVTPSTARARGMDHEESSSRSLALGLAVFVAAALLFVVAGTLWLKRKRG